MSKSNVAKKNMMKPEPSTASMPDAPTAVKKAGPDEWEVKDGLSTLMKAHQLSQDPKMMKHIKKHAKSQKQAIGAVSSMFPEDDADKDPTIDSMDGFSKRRKSREINPVGDE